MLPLITPLLLLAMALPASVWGQASSLGRLSATEAQARQAGLSPLPRHSPQHELVGWQLVSQTDSTLVISRTEPQPGLAICIYARLAPLNSAGQQPPIGELMRAEPNENAAQILHFRLYSPAQLATWPAPLILLPPPTR
jgi:hypothetical protein